MPENKGVIGASVDKLVDAAEFVKEKAVDVKDKIVGNHVEDTAANSIKKKVSALAGKVTETRESTADKIEEAAHAMERAID